MANPLAAIVGSALGSLPIVGNFFSGVESRLYQQENQDYMRRQMRLQAEREDNAVQRRVADLRSAGLSPTLAAGSAAGAGALADSPGIEPNRPDPISDLNAIAGIMSAIQGIKGQELDNDWKRLQVANFNETVRDPAVARKLLAEEQTTTARHLNKYSEETGLPPGKVAPVSVEGFDAIIDALGNSDLTVGQKLLELGRGFLWIMSGRGAMRGTPKKGPTVINK